MIDKAIHRNPQVSDYFKDLIKETCKFDEILVDFNKNIEKLP